MNSLPGAALSNCNTMHTFTTLNRFLLSLIFILSITVVAHAQGKIGSVKGTVMDTAANKALASATINVLDAKDSTLVTFARSRDNGTFEVSKLNPGNYLLLVSYTGFAKKHLPFTITNDKPVADLSAIPLTSNSTLEDVVVVAAPVTLKGDTVEFNAGSFKVNKPNAVVEDLLKRLPGVEVDKDGNIKANGQDVKRILVDGKEFFGNDPKLATKNLQADMVNKVQVFERKSDQSQFTGFDDGNTEPTINLTLKNDKRNGIFGRATAGAGTDGRYQGNANINRFQKGEQMSFVGSANNTNQQNFSLLDALGVGGGGGATAIVRTVGSGIGGLGGFGGNGQGITATQSAGLNYNNFKKSNLEVTSSYFFNGTQLRNDYVTRNETFLADSSQRYTENGYTNRNNYNHRINAAIDWKMDSNNSIRITPSISFQNTRSFSGKDFITNSSKGLLLSNGFNRTDNTTQGFNANVTALYRHRFNRAGRTFSTELRVGGSNSEGEGSQYTVNNRSLPNIGFRADTLDQRNFTDNQSGNLGLTLRYTEPMSRRSLLELSAFYNKSNSQRDQRTFDRNRLTGQYDVENERLTNFIDNDYNTTGGGVKFRENRQGWNYTIGADVQRAELTSLLQGKSTPISQSFLNLLPNAQLQISKNRYRNFRLIYNGTTNNPSVTQLQPIEDISDPLNIKRGNPNLKQSFVNNFRINYTSFDPYTMKSFFAFVNLRQTNNAIVNNDSIFATGGQLTKYLNADGVWSSNANVNMGFPVTIANAKANINIGTGANYSRNVNYQNDLKNLITNINLTQRLSGSYNYKELFDVTLGGNINWTRATQSLRPQGNNNFWSYSADFETNWYLPKNLTIGTTVAYNGNAGRAEGFNLNYTLWNAYVSKGILKNKKGEIRLSVNDLLNQNTGVDRSASGNVIRDSQYTVLKRYVLLSFTYNLSRFGNIGGGGGGMMRGGGMRMIMQ